MLSFASSVDRTDDLDFDEALNYFGMHFSGRRTIQSKPSKGTDSKEQTEVPKEAVSRTPWLGAKISDNTVSSVVADSPATKAGLNPDDEILAINDYRLTGSIESWINKYQVGDELDFLISRGGRLTHLPVTLGPRPNNT